MPINQFTQQSNFLLAAMAGAERIFEAMRLPPEVDEGRIRLVNTRGEGVTQTACAEKTGRWAWQKPDGSLVLCGGTCGSTTSPLATRKAAPILQNISLYAQARPEDRLRGLHRRGQDHHHQPHQPLLRHRRRRRHLRRHRRAGHRQGLAAAVAGHRAAGHPPVHRHHCRQHPLRQAGRHPEEIVRAARIANADSFIRRLPQGYDTRITSDGASLSQGQRQLLAIARAAVADPPVLIPGRGHQLHRHPHRA